MLALSPARLLRARLFRAAAAGCLLWLTAGAAIAVGCDDDDSGVEGADVDDSHVSGSDVADAPGDRGDALDSSGELTDGALDDGDAARVEDSPGQPDVAEAVPVPDPAAYDCSVADEPPPARTSAVPLGCVLDPECTEPMIVGHRGIGTSLAPENSLSGIRGAIVLGLDGAELDVRTTADDVLVLMHDGSVDRTTTSVGEIAEMTADQATQLFLRPPNDSDGDFSCDRVPTLQQAFDVSRDRIVLHLDAKTGRTDLVALAIEEAGMLDQVIISCPDFARAELARATVAAVRVQVRPDSETDVESAFALFPERPPEVFEVPDVVVGLVAGRVHDAQAAVLTNAWGADAMAFVTGDVSLYLEHYEAGADIIQAEMPLFALHALGRYP